MMSVPPPAPAPTMMRTGFTGYVCAVVTVAHTSSANAIIHFNP